MKEDKKIEQIFNRLYGSTIIVSIVLLLGFLAIYSLTETDYSPKKFVFAYVIPIFLFTFFFSYNYLLTYCYKKGAFKSKQAIEFYRMCNKSGISFLGDTNMEKAEDIYFSIFGTDKYLGEGTLISHMTKIYNIGKEIIEK